MASDIERHATICTTVDLSLTGLRGRTKFAEQFASYAAALADLISAEKASALLAFPRTAAEFSDWQKYKGAALAASGRVMKELAAFGTMIRAIRTPKTQGDKPYEQSAKAIEAAGFAANGAVLKAISDAIFGQTVPEAPLDDLVAWVSALLRFTSASESSQAESSDSVAAVGYASTVWSPLVALANASAPAVVKSARSQLVTKFKSLGQTIDTEFEKNVAGRGQKKAK